MNSLRRDWLSNVRNDLLAGLVVAPALIPEAIALSHAKSRLPHIPKDIRFNE